MLRVKTKLAVSNIHGIGLFAAEFIPKGTVTWQYDPKFDVGFTQEDVDALPKVARDTFYHFAYFDESQNLFILCSDNQRFINHTTGETNIESTPNQDVASKDIAEGEEFLCDYFKFDPTYFPRLGIEPE